MDKPWYSLRPGPERRAARDRYFATIEAREKREWKLVEPGQPAVYADGDLLAMFGGQSYHTFDPNDTAAMRLATLLALGPWDRMPKYLAAVETDFGYLEIRDRRSKKSAVVVLRSWQSFRVAYGELKTRKQT